MVCEVEEPIEVEDEGSTYRAIRTSGTFDKWNHLFGPVEVPLIESRLYMEMAVVDEDMITKKYIMITLKSSCHKVIF